MVDKANHKKIFFLSILFCFNSLLGLKAQQVNENGYNVFYYPSGKKLSEGSLKNGKPEGYWKTYYENGKLKTEGNRKNHELDSTWKFYTEKGIITSEISYKTGKKNGITKTYNEKGVLVSEEMFFNNIKQGKATYFYETGEPKMQVAFDNGVETGTAYEFGKDGRIITIQEYKGARLMESQEVNRVDENGNKIGKWIEYYGDSKTKIKSETNYRAGVKEGVSKEYDENGNLLKLEQFENGIVNDSAQEFVFIDIRTVFHENGTPKLVGGYANNKKQGIFREYDSNGDSAKVINSFIYDQDIMLSEGIIDNSGVYRGPWKIYYTTGELKEEGEYLDGVKEGEWKYYYRNGAIEQKGKYVKGKIHGPWYWFYTNGKKHREETYRYGKEEGITTEYDSVGNVITRGEYLAGLKDGEWYYDLGDHIEKGRYAGGDREAEWVYIYKDNGQTAFKGKYKNGLAEGKHVYYQKNGKPDMQGKYKNGLKHGEWTKFDERGFVDFVITYKNGVEVEYDGERIKKKGERTEVNTTFE
ncbi:MAG TPA: toxin-antitoxin system YwqK family antitoxin [Flavobacteriales bacterium]|nr:toxin-antitoxin system YwqK family antitoxin [Flavobacteriales bacterium]